MSVEIVIELLSGRLPPVEEEIVAVEDTLARKAALDHHNHQQQEQHHRQQRQDYVVHEPSPYCASASVPAANSIPPATQPTLLNYLQMDTPSQSYASSLQFDHARQSAPNQAQSPLTVQENNIFTFSGKTNVSSTPQVSEDVPRFLLNRNTFAVEQMGTILMPQVQQQSPVQQLQSQQAMMQAAGGFLSAVNVFDCPPSTHQGAFQRQNSGGSEHGFVVPSPAQFVSQLLF